MTELPQGNKLPILKIFILSIQLVRQKITTFIRFGIPLLILVLIGFLSVFVFRDNITNYFLSGGSIFTSLIMLFIIFAIFTMVAVGCHRGFLMSETDIYNTNTFRFEMREWRFMGWSLVIGLFVGILYLLIGFILSSIFYNNLSNLNNANIIIQFLGFPILYLFSRWSLVLPATAVEDDEASLTDAWALSENNGWRVTILVSGIPFVIDLILSLLPSYNSIIYFIITSTIWLLIAVFEIGLLSLSYAFLKGNETNDEETLA